MCDELEKVGLPWCTPNGTKVNYHFRQQNEMYKRMYESGCYQITLACESGVQRVLDEARAAGVDFGNTEEMLLSLQQLPIAKTIFPRENWTAIIIKERTRELLGLAWDEMNDWLFV